MQINVQLASRLDDLPSESDYRGWAESVLARAGSQAELTLRIVDLEEGKQLNERFRGASGATNVLAFPLGDAELAPGLLGDVVMCAPVVRAEAARQHKPADAHWAHMVIHGTLHLLGYDHKLAPEAEQMETLERTILAELGYPDPYL